jgi:uncharacterized protein YkwD
MLACAAMATAGAARADVVTLLNSMRATECAPKPARASPLKHSAALDAAARELSRRTPLTDAIGRAGYPARRSSSLHVKGAPNEDAIRRELAKGYCSTVGDATLTELGAFRRGDEVWFVLAAPEIAPPPLVPRVQEARVLELVNAARAKPRKCGRQEFGAAPPVLASAALREIAFTHSVDMAAHHNLDHKGSDGTKPAERVTRAGYEWRGTGENVAAGQRDAEAVVAAWLESPGHCVNIMEPGYTEMGVAFALDPGANPGIYWTQVFATPKSPPAAPDK